MTSPADHRLSMQRLVRRHLRFGITALLVFVALGSVLESLHGFKVAWYLDVGEETRRLVWRLGHAHGTMLSLLHLVIGGAVLKSLPDAEAAGLELASKLLIVGALLVPGGFLLGGVWTHGGDPGLGIFLVPLGALALLLGLLMLARAVWRGTEAGPKPDGA